MDRLKNFLAEELATLRSLFFEGLRSGTYIYPFKGIYYFLTNHDLRKPLLSKIAPTISLSLLITTTMFFFTYIPQAAILSLTNGPFIAPFSTVLLVLSESSTITTFFARRMMLEDSLIDTFDGTLVSCGNEDLVAHGRQVKASSSGRPVDSVGRLGSLVKKGHASLVERVSISNLLKSFVYLPLNFIPVVGTLMYISSQGRRAGPLSHFRYFQLKGWDSKRRDQWVKDNRVAYTSFGAAAFMLEMVPFASLAFAYTNTIGGALWASNLEKASAKSQDTHE